MHSIENLNGNGNTIEMFSVNPSKLKSHLLNQHQKTSYDTIMKAENYDNGGIFFLDAPGGETFLISLIIDTIQAQSQISLAVALSGIAATFSFCI